MFKKAIDELFRWLGRQAEVRDGIRCNICLERFSGLANDCACTNWGGFVGL